MFVELFDLIKACIVYPMLLCSDQSVQDPLFTKCKPLSDSYLFGAPKYPINLLTKALTVSFAIVRCTAASTMYFKCQSRIDNACVFLYA